MNTKQTVPGILVAILGCALCLVTAAQARPVSVAHGDLELLGELQLAADSTMSDGVGFLYCHRARFTAEAFLSYYVDNAMHDTPALRPKITMPTLVIAGSDDNTVSDVPKRTQAHIDDNTKLVVIDGADHFSTICSPKIWPTRSRNSPDNTCHRALEQIQRHDKIAGCRRVRTGNFFARSLNQCSPSSGTFPATRSRFRSPCR